MGTGLTGSVPMSKEEEVMDYLHREVFDPVLISPTASGRLKRGVRQTVARLLRRDARGMVHFYWAAVVGTEKSVMFAHAMRDEGFTRFEEVLEDFRARFNDVWLRS